MSQIVLQNVSLELPIYNADSFSFKKTLVDSARVGKLRDRRGKVTVLALDSVSLILNEGDRLGIVGNNGSGKTTLLRLLAGVYAPTSGTFERVGKVDSLLAIGAGMDLEQDALANIKLKLTILGASKHQVEERSRTILEFADLGEFASLPVRTYSSGMLVRLGFAIATSVVPEILLMDEWLSAGDADFGRKAQARIREVVDSSKILAIASHSRGTIERACNQVLWLESGRVRMHGEPKEVLDAYFG
jgi:lipopolysaccharide transport system ATP-binding protein